ncbi:neuromedin-S [Molossus nigricans]
MKHLPQFPFILAVYCFCLLQNPSSGYPPHSDGSPDGLDAVQLEDPGAVALDFIKKVCKLCGEHKPPKTTCERTGKYLELRHRAASLDDFWKELDHAATWGRPFFLFRPRNGRNTEDNTQ